MNSVTKLALLACLGLTVAAVPGPAVADKISERLDALERENAALRARLNASKRPRRQSCNLGRRIRAPVRRSSRCRDR